MLCRWDMQGAPPDILVTNYSMLEHMLVRPIESPIFDATRVWLAGADDRVVTLVLDEAHTYTGAKGTEVAHLVRRLKERLGIASGSNQFRAIATSASIPAIKGAESDLVRFTSDLFGEPDESFTLIHAGITDEAPPARSAKPGSLAAFALFHDTFETASPWRGIKELAQSLDLAEPDDGQDAQVALHQLLSDNEDLKWVRARTARNATRLSELAQECWPNSANLSDQERATAGLLAAGSFARPTALPDTPPILSMRLQREATRERIRRALGSKLDRFVEEIANGNEVHPENIRPYLVEAKSGTRTGDLFRFATLLWSIPVSQGYGRRLRFLVKDRANGKLIGIFALGDPVFNLRARDAWIGWDQADRREKLVNLSSDPYWKPSFSASS